MVRVKLGLVLAGALFAVTTVGCQEVQQLKAKVGKLEIENGRLNQTVTERDGQLAQARDDNTKLAAERDMLKLDLERERASKPVRGSIEGPDERPVRNVREGGALAGGWIRTAVGDRLTLGGHMLFPSGSATLTAEGKSALNKVANDLKSTYSGRTVRVYGFTDSSPIVKTKNLWEDNLDLSANRAMAVVRYLWAHGVSKEKIETVAMGDAHPLASNGTAEGKKKNRRVEIFVIHGR